MWVPSWYSNFLPQSKDMHVRLISDFKLPIGVNVSVCGCFSLGQSICDELVSHGAPCLLLKNSGEQ